ncbi:MULTISPECIES: hypothetical protein [Streptomyces]|uniref:hypothetical protein n=1 Tax=Streptomyces TaxID=1883 RepID=UPI001EFAAD8D|nr:hypothetical protein [Streptomyces sp. CL12-4]MCG8970554.1 hypothetical protein [Streptomyces sp. CL12-4]
MYVVDRAAEQAAPGSFHPPAAAAEATISRSGWSVEDRVQVPHRGGRPLRQDRRRLLPGGSAAIAHPSKFGPDPLGRQDGDPLPHPKVPTRNRRALLAWWGDVKRTSTVRDWHALSQGDPQLSEGALVSRDLLRSIRAGVAVVEPQKVAVSIDPSGGGRGTAGVIGGFLGADNRVWTTHDRTQAMSSAEWSRTACLLVHETDAAVNYVEWNFGRDMCTAGHRHGLAGVAGRGLDPRGQAEVDDRRGPGSAGQAPAGGADRAADGRGQGPAARRVRRSGERVGDVAADRPARARIDASCILVYGLIPEANKGAIVHAPLPGGAVAEYGRRIGK